MPCKALASSFAGLSHSSKSISDPQESSDSSMTAPRGHAYSTPGVSPDAGSVHIDIDSATGSDKTIHYDDQADVEIRLGYAGRTPSAQAMPASAHTQVPTSTTSSS